MLTAYLRRVQLVSVPYADHHYRLFADLSGGTRDQPLLKPADQLLLDWWRAEGGGAVSVLHDLTGALSVVAGENLMSITNDNHQHDLRVAELYEANNRAELPTIGGPLEDHSASPIGLLRVPKSLALFGLYLHWFARTAPPGARLAAAFMTRHFSAGLLDAAGRYAGRVTQSRAFKKARLLFLDDFLPVDNGGQNQENQARSQVPTRNVAYGQQTYAQYPGVFAADHVDYATRFLLDSWTSVPALSELPAPERMVDAACGSGIIGDQLLRRYPAARLFAYDVSRVAVASARRNLTVHGERATVELAAELAGEVEPDSVDLVVTNPPFHDGYRNDIGVALELFADAQDCLKRGGHLVVVANRHLNYQTHLKRLFTETVTVAETEKFVVYRCRK